MHRLLWFLVVFSLLPKSAVSQDSRVMQLKELFAHPPDNARIMMRWWWFGPAVTKDEIKRELEQMKAAGIGGVEIATLYPLASDDSHTGFHNMAFLSDEHIEALHFAAEQARQLGMRVDITLGSGWPYGGPHIPIEQAAGVMRVERIAIENGEMSVAIPNLSSGEKLAAVFLAGPGEPVSFDGAKHLEKPDIRNGRLQISSNESRFANAVFFVSSRTGMMVKRPAIGAEGFVLDHYDQKAIETHLKVVGDRLMEAFGDRPPFAVFSDSLEDYGSDWTPELLTEFQQRRGYDLTPHLPALVADVGPETQAVRHDWGRTLTELADEHYLQPLHAWAQRHHTLLRSQTYGFPPVSLSSNQYEDLPEGEGKATVSMWRQFSDARWAASAGHLLGKPVISSETWTWLHSPAFRATPLDMKAEADLHFLQGINQLVGHGWPYSPEVAGEPGWRMYAAGAFDANNPWWFAMSDLTAYLQRVSFALRQGKPANDVALLLPNDDAWASFTVNGRMSEAVTTKGGFNARGRDVSIDESMGDLLGTTVIPQILDAGFNFDFMDADFINRLGISYPILVLPGVDRLPVATYRRIEQYAQGGGIVIATRRLPSTAPGLLNAEAESEEIREISRRLFDGPMARGHFVENEVQLGRALATYSKPDVSFSSAASEIGFIHRKLELEDLYFIANTSSHSVRAEAKFRAAAKSGEWWDPFSGGTSGIENPRQIHLDLQPYESRVIFLKHTTEKPTPHPPEADQFKDIDLSSNWDLLFNGTNQTLHMATLHSWSDEESLKHYSGQVTYTRTVDIPKQTLQGNTVILDFGEGTEVAKPNPLPIFNMRAYLEGPVREAAEVYVNGSRAGVVWHPPYVLDVTSLLTPGKNALRITVGNTAINALSGQALPDYRLLNDRYGERFVPQGMENLRPLPSGIVSVPHLTVMHRK